MFTYIYTHPVPIRRNLVSAGYVWEEVYKLVHSYTPGTLLQNLYRDHSLSSLSRLIIIYIRHINHPRIIGILIIKFQSILQDVMHAIHK